MHLCGLLVGQCLDERGHHHGHASHRGTSVNKYTHGCGGLRGRGLRIGGRCRAIPLLSRGRHAQPVLSLPVQDVPRPR
jgi:hypothetical protein